MSVDREQICEFKLAYMAMFDQIAHPDGSNYPRLRHWVWSVIEYRFGEADKHSQSQALSALTYTTMVTALAAAAAESLGIAADEDDVRRRRLEKAAWVLGLSYALGLTHPESVSGETALAVLDEDAFTRLCTASVPRLDDGVFWGEFKVLGEALFSRMFGNVALSPPQR